MAVLSAPVRGDRLRFGSPLVGTVILTEAAGLGDSMLPLVFLPGPMPAGIGLPVFTGAARWTGLDSSAYALSPVPVPDIGTVTPAQTAW